MSRRKPKQSRKQRLRDIPSMKELSTTVTGMKNLKRIMPVLGPLLGVAGVDLVKIKDALNQVDDLAKQTEELINFPDRFNDCFAEHGWIMYGMMNVEVAKSALEKASSGDLQGAEQELVNYYNVETVRWQLNRLKSLKAFKPRIKLALKALKDYEEERYHACIPVVLALTDGLVNELHEDHRGLFAETTELEAWDSLAAHNRGLGRIVKILRKGRYKTTTEKINLPYRHGIMHGTDLGYDNIIVAAKTWATLFAVGEWATRVERGEVNAPEEKPKETFQELLAKIRETEELKKEIENWEPRKSIPLEAELFEVGSAERVLYDFLLYWSKKNYGGMTIILPHKLFDEKVAPARIREYYKDRLLKSFEIVSIVDIALATTHIEVRLQIEEYGKLSEKLHKFIMILEDPQGHVAGRRTAKARWVSYTWRIW